MSKLFYYFFCFVIFSAGKIYSQVNYIEYKLGKIFLVFYENGTVVSKELDGNGIWIDDGNTIMIELYSNISQSNIYLMAYDTGIGSNESINVFDPNDILQVWTMKLVGNRNEDFNKLSHSDDISIEKYLIEADTYLKEENYKEAIKSYSKALSNINENTLNGNDLSSRGHYGKALSQFNLDIKRGTGFKHSKIKDVRKDSKFDQSIFTWENVNYAIEYNNMCAECYNLRGMYLVEVNRNGNLKEKVYKENPELDIKNAFNDFDKAIEIDSTVAEYYKNMGILNLNKKNLEKALDDINIAIQLDPLNESYKTILNSIHNKMK